MTRSRKFMIAAMTIAAVLVLSIGGLQLWLWRSPLVLLGGAEPGGEIFDRQTAVGRVFANVQECGEQQKNLYLCIEACKEEHDRLPEDMDALINSVDESVSFSHCPAGLTGYEVHFENYGNVQAVLIKERRNRHRTAFKLWVRGIKPCVQAMGDGTIHLFAGGKLATIQAKKK